MARQLKLVVSNDKRAVVYFRPGDAIPQTGIYRVFHSNHRLSHDVTLLQGEKFPECITCKDDVHFELLRPAPQIGTDASFMREPIRLYQIPHLDDQDEQQEPIKRVV